MAENQSDRHRIESARVLVAGDVMLDRYWFGNVQRISPEAPVPVVQVRHTEERPGGAANVALNVKHLGAQVGLIGIVGQDEPGATLSRLVADQHIDANLLIDEQASTVVKLRVIGQQQQMLRVDFEQPPRETVSAQMLPAVQKQISGKTALVLSDYDKGALIDPIELIRLARQQDCPVIVDPKGDDFSRYAGATVLTPNRGELRACVGAWRNEQDLTDRAMNLRASLGVAYLLLTRSEDGMSLYSDDGVTHIGAQAREVFDVSGAGDTVVAVVAAAIGARIPVERAVRLANRAGALVVAKLGAASVGPEELFARS